MKHLGSVQVWTGSGYRTLYAAGYGLTPKRQDATRFDTAKDAERAAECAGQCPGDSEEE